MTRFSYFLVVGIEVAYNKGWSVGLEIPRRVVNVLINCYIGHRGQAAFSLTTLPADKGNRGIGDNLRRFIGGLPVPVGKQSPLIDIGRRRYISHRSLTGIKWLLGINSNADAH